MMNQQISRYVKFILTILGAYVVAHFFALFGVFFALGYVVAFIFIPKTTLCFLCNALPRGKKCPFCKTKIRNNLRPKTLRSAFLNTLLIILLSIPSLGLIFVEQEILKVLGYPTTPITAEFVIPEKRQYRLGEIFPMRVEVSGVKTPINVVQVDIGYNPDRLEVVDVDTSASFATVFLQKEINNEVGYYRLTGGLPNPGYSESDGVFCTVYFRSKAAGIVEIKFLPSSKILANDGNGTNTIRSLSKASYLILNEPLTEEEKSLQETIFAPAILGTNTRIDQIFFYEKDRIEKSQVLEDNVKIDELPVVTTNVSLQETTFRPANPVVLGTETDDSPIFLYERDENLEPPIQNEINKLEVPQNDIQEVNQNHQTWWNVLLYTLHRIDKFILVTVSSVVTSFIDTLNRLL